MSEIEESAKSIVRLAAKKLSPLTFITAQVRKLDRAGVDALAAAYLLSQVKLLKRSQVHAIERDSSKLVQQPATPEQQAARDQIDVAIEERSRASWKELIEQQNRAIDRYVEHLRIDWTNELLASRFALGDGTTTTWGEATREQHQHRAQMHTANATAGMEGAARHLKAIETIDSAGCSTLLEALKQAA